MICPNCQSANALVRDSRIVRGDRQRRRVCWACRARWFTHEVMVEGTLDIPKPEPEWWSEARALRRQGLSYSAIGKELSRPQSAVSYALRPAFRDAQKQRMRVSAAHPEVKAIRRLKQEALA
jgi:hypothetical protein